MSRFGLLLLVAACAACLLPPAAGAQEPWRPVGASCVGAVATVGCTAASSLAGAWNTTLAPGGRTAYAAGFTSGAIAVLDRDPATGALRPRACINEGGASGCAEGRGLGSPDGIAIAPDGRRVHVSGWDEGSGSSVAVLRRDPATSALGQQLEKSACIVNGASSECQDGHGLSSLAGPLQASADGRHLYVGVNPVAVVRSAADGTLSQDAGQGGCVSTPAQDGCLGVAGLDGGRQPVLSPDGRQLYVATAEGVVVLDRNPQSGALTQRGGGRGCLTATPVTGCTTEPRVAGATGLTTSADGRQVYAATTGGMVTLARAADGGLAVQSCVREPATSGCATGTDVRGLAYAGVSPDGRDLVASRLGAGGGLVAFSRDPATGDLARRPGAAGCLTADGRNSAGAAGACLAHPALGSDGHVTFGSDLHLYLGSFSTSAITTVKRDFAPTCAPAAAAVPHNVAASVGLPCADRNGDPLTFAVVDPPRSGSLGAIDQARATVQYDPFGGFAGADGFTFRAESTGQASAPAAAALTVAPAAAPPAAPARPITSVVSTQWGFRGRQVFLIGLAVRTPPRGARVELRCAPAKGSPCPFRRRATTRRTGRAITLLERIPKARAARTRARTFRAGHTLQVRITAPGRIGKVVVFRLRKGVVPKGRQRCLPPGERTPRKRCRAA